MYRSLRFAAASAEPRQDLLGEEARLAHHRLMKAGDPRGSALNAATARDEEISGTAHQGAEVIPLDGCYLGWQDSLVLLAKLVEAEIPG